MEKYEIFISHLSEEQEVAISFKELIESVFLGMVEVFVSSDDSSNPMGGRWLDQITKSLKTCSIEIIFCSPQSIVRPWINFESGAGWVRDIPVIPICHAGLSKKDLQLPLSLLQAANASSEKDLDNVIKRISNKLGSKVPEVDFSKFISIVKNYDKKNVKPLFYLPLKENFCNEGRNKKCEFSVFPHLKSNSGIPERVEFKDDGYFFNGNNMLTVHMDNSLPEETAPRSFAFAMKPHGKPKRNRPMFFFSYGQRKEHEKNYVNNHEKAFGLFWGIPIVDGDKGHINQSNKIGVKIFFYCEKKEKDQISEICDTENIFIIEQDEMYSWIRVVITYDGKNLKLYKNGEQLYSKDIELKTATSRYLNVGGFLHHSIKGAFIPTDIDYSMKGHIREFYIFDKSLTHEDITKLDEKTCSIINLI